MLLVAGIEYCGTHYCGWQDQLNHQPTIQAYVETALTNIANHPIKTICAGRTDSKVHALQQVIHFESSADRDLNEWQQGTNALLPNDIRMQWIKTVPDDFSARFSAYARRYMYLLNNQSSAQGVLHDRSTWVRNTLDVAKMNEACQYLLGTKDFSAFRAASCSAPSPVRTITIAEVKQLEHWIWFTIEGNAFLHHMVRNIMGALLSIGKGQRDAQWIEALLEGKKREHGAPTAPAQGLYLCAVKYPEAFAIPEIDPTAFPVILETLKAQYQNRA